MVSPNIYFELTDLFNDGECRAVLGSGQARRASPYRPRTVAGVASR